MPEVVSDSQRINASPTKEFFIFMLVRDIPLSRAIIDLVDNSVDGAHRLRGGGNFDGLWVRIEVDPRYFRIADNCGGIPVPLARDYAFRFGRPKEAPPVEGSIGQFGVGMKRTFFKLGRRFRVHSATAVSRFTVEEDVDEWIARQSESGAEDWHFEFKTLEENITVLPEHQGTTIEIERLHESVAESFGIELFLNRLSQEMELAHALNLQRGLSVTLNSIPLEHDPMKLLHSEQLQPAFVERIFDRFGPKPVRVKLYAGVSDRVKEEGGWYVFCNGRLVVKADQTNLTVWGEGERVPKYHPDFARFRGFAFFDCDDSSLLPWTTTKTGVDIDSPVYRAGRQEMIEITRPVLDFLRKVEDERKRSEEGEITDTPLATALSTAQPLLVEDLSPSLTFQAPQPPPQPQGPRMRKIQYWKPEDQIEKAKGLLGVSSLKEVGEKTFEYYLAYEGGGSDS